MLTPHSIVMEIPSVENIAPMGAMIKDYNSILPDISKGAGATFVALPMMPEPHTFDGVHLNAAGYEIWNEAVLHGAATICSSR